MRKFTKVCELCKKDKMLNSYLITGIVYQLCEECGESATRIKNLLETNNLKEVQNG